MSLHHEINKITGDIRRSVGRLAKSAVADGNGVPAGTEKIIGYVCAIHEDGELAGTVDVQEYDYYTEEDMEYGAGHHEGVLLSAIQDNATGMFIVPMLFSEVVIIRNPIDGREYVLMYSHAKRINLKATSLESEKDGKIQIGVSEVEAYKESDEGIEQDFNELPPTQNQSLSTYTSSSIIHSVSTSDDGYEETINSKAKTIEVGDTKVTIDGENVSIQTSGKVSFTIGGTKISHENGKVSIETTNCEIKGTNVKITGGTLQTQGVSSADMNGPFNAIKVCPFSGAPHCGSSVSGT